MRQCLTMKADQINRSRIQTRKGTGVQTRHQFCRRTHMQSVPLPHRAAQNLTFIIGIGNIGRFAKFLNRDAIRHNLGHINPVH